MTRILFIIAGTVCVALGVIGIFLPLMPTTVFLLLAAYFYSRSSERFYQLLLKNRYLGTYIHNYRAGHGMTLRHKVNSVTMLWLTVGVSLWLIESLALRMLLFLIASSVSIFLLRFVKTYRPEKGPDTDQPA
jgi:uncharacterized membrane protein YbaN (DUF454 family)